MTIPLSEKVPLLKGFHEFLESPDWSYTKSTCKDGVVLEKFPVVSFVCCVFLNAINYLCTTVPVLVGVRLSTKKSPYSRLSSSLLLAVNACVDQW